MNSKAIVLAALVSLFASTVAYAAQPAGTINQLSGMVVAVKPDGRQRILATASRVEVGDTLVSEAESYVRLLMDNGNEALLGPSTTLKVVRFTAQETALTLANGQVNVTGGLQQGQGHRFTVEAAGTTSTVGAASFILAYVAPDAKGVAALRRSWLRNSLAAAGSGPPTDGADNLPLREIVAQLNRGPTPPTPGGLQAGLHVFVLDGIINLSNVGGSQAFSSGQFGFVRSNITPPVLVPNNPGLKFTPPPAFTVTNPNPTNNNNQPKPETVDCEVR